MNNCSFYRRRLKRCWWGGCYKLHIMLLHFQLPPTGLVQISHSLSISSSCFYLGCRRIRTRKPRELASWFLCVIAKVKKWFGSTQGFGRRCQRAETETEHCFATKESSALTCDVTVSHIPPETQPGARETIKADLWWFYRLATSIYLIKKLQWRRINGEKAFKCDSENCPLKH